MRSGAMASLWCKFFVKSKTKKSTPLDGLAGPGCVHNTRQMMTYQNELHNRPDHFSLAAHIHDEWRAA